MLIGTIVGQTIAIFSVLSTASMRMPSTGALIRSFSRFCTPTPRQNYAVCHRRSSRYCCTRGGVPLETTELPTTELYERIRNYYTKKQTDGILELALSESMIANVDLNIENDLVPAILSAVGMDNKGAIASIVNAFIGSGLVEVTKDTTDNLSAASLKKLDLVSDRIILLMKLMEENVDISFDIVAYSLAYSVLSINPDAELANFFLEKAERNSKKIAGGKRRKILASARRKPVSSFFEAEDKLKELLGEDFEVFVETEGFAVINKPSGIPCFHKKLTSAGKLKRSKGQKRRRKNKQVASDISLEDALVSCNVALSTLNPEALGLVHRLDAGSSGVLVMAKSNEIHANMLSEFFLRRTTKKYVALLRQSSTSLILKEEYGSIDQPVNGRPARSDYRLLERYHTSNNECVAALVEFEICTGRKHQIRRHSFEALSSPVWNDPLYTNDTVISKSCDNQTNETNSKRFFLHACELKVPKFQINVKASKPSWWESTICELNDSKGGNQD